MGLRDLIVQKWQHKESRVRLQAVEQLEGKNAEAILRTLAMTDSSRAVRKAAAKRLGIAALGEVFRNTTNESVRLDMVLEVLDAASHQELILEIALSDSSGYVRNAAAHKLVDEALLYRAALSDTYVDVAVIAARQLSSPDKTAYIASKAPFPAVRSEGLRSLSRDGYLDNLIAAAKSDEDATVRETAVRLLQSEDCPELFVEIATSDLPARLRAAAVEKLDAAHHLELLYRLATFDANAAIRKTALTSLDPFDSLSLLVRIAETDADAIVRRTAVDRIDVESLPLRLLRIASSDADKHVQKGASQKVALLKKSDKKEISFEPKTSGPDEWNAFLIKVALKAEDPLVREAALIAVDPHKRRGTIEKIASSDKDSTVRRAAVKKLEPSSSKALLESILEKDKDRSVRRIAEAKLNSLKSK